MSCSTKPPTRADTPASSAVHSYFSNRKGAKDVKFFVGVT